MIWKIEENETHIDNFKDFDWKNSTPADWIAFAKAGPWPEPGITRDECRAIAEALDTYGNEPIRILEIGQCYGTSTRVFLGKILRDGGELHSCEMTIREGFRDKMMEMELWDYIRVHEVHSQRLHWEAPLDFLFIDGEHCLEDALGEYMRFRRVMNKDGKVAFHDAESCFGVRRAIDLIQNEIDEVELVSQSIGNASSGLKVFKIVKLGKAPGQEELISIAESLKRARQEASVHFK